MPTRPISIPPGSENIAAVDYDDEKRELWITFYKGQYVYKDVSRGVAEGFGNGGFTAGQYFRSNILNQYQFDRMS